MSDSYGYILAELLKRNTELHGRELCRIGEEAKWPGNARKIIMGELREYKASGGLKAFSGLVWHKLRKQDVTTRQIYGLLLQWALLLTEKELLGFYTADYEALIEELRHNIESGAEGVVEDIPAEEILEEWEFMKQYLMALHGECEGWIKNEDKKQKALSFCP